MYHFNRHELVFNHLGVQCKNNSIGLPESQSDKKILTLTPSILRNPTPPKNLWILATPTPQPWLQISWNVTTLRTGTTYSSQRAFFPICTQRVTTTGIDTGYFESRKSAGHRAVWCSCLQWWQSQKRGCDVSGQIRCSSNCWQLASPVWHQCNKSWQAQIKYSSCCVSFRWLVSLDQC